MEFKRFFAVRKGEAPEHVMPANNEQLKAAHTKMGYDFSPTMDTTESGEMQDVARELGEGAEVDVYEVTFRKIKSGRVEQAKQFRLVEE